MFQSTIIDLNLLYRMHIFDCYCYWVLFIAVIKFSITYCPKRFSCVLTDFLSKIHSACWSHITKGLHNSFHIFLTQSKRKLLCASISSGFSCVFNDMRRSKININMIFFPILVHFDPQETSFHARQAHVLGMIQFWHYINFLGLFVLFLVEVS